MRLTILFAILLAFTLPACMDSPVTEGNYNLPEKDFESYIRERDILQNSNNSGDSAVDISSDE
jgi:hypothetical protein